jgi:hypothetical protein
MGDSMSTIINATTTNGVVIQPDNSGSLVLQTNSGTTAVTIDTSQTVGINTPGRPAGVGGGDNGKLWVKQTTTGNYGIAAIASATDSFTTIATNGTTGVISTSYGLTGSYLPLAFHTSDVERMRIDSSGNVLVGTTTATSSGFIQTTSSNSKYGWVSKASTTNGAPAGFFNLSGTEVGSISTSASATSYATSSDYRLKENIAPMIGALDKVAQLKPVTYKWKIDGSDGQGFIAHELQAIVPDCVYGEKDAIDTEGNPEYQGVDTSFLVATLTAAIQEQQTIINDLKARVETLEAK